MPQALKNPPINPLKRLFRLLAPERKDLILLYIYAIIAGFISLSLPLGIQAIINFVSFGQMTTSWIVMVVLVLAGLALGGVLQVLQLSISEGIQQRIFVNSAFEFAYRVPRLKPGPLHHRYMPELINRFFDTINVQKGVAKLLLDLPAAFLQILFGLVLLSFYHPLFMAFGIVLVLLLGLLVRFTGPVGLRASIEESKYKYKVAHWLQDLGRSLNMFKLFRSSQLHLQKTDELVEGYLEARKKHFSILLLKYWMMVAFQIIIMGSLLFLGGLLVQSNEINIGQLVASEIVIILLISSVEKFVMSMETVYDLLTGLDKIGYVTDLELDSPDGHKVPKIEGESGYKIDIQGLGFNDLQTGIAMLDPYSSTIEAGETVRVEGCNTSSVHAMMDAIVGIRTEFTGSLLINGLSIKEICLETYRSSLGTALFDRDLFEGTILENITLDKNYLDTKTGSRVMEVIRAVGLEEYVANQGLAAKILPKGINLAGTIRRKIVLARALMVDARMLILQTPYRGLNSDERNDFLVYLKAKFADATIIIVSDNARHDSQMDAILDPQCLLKP